MAEELATEVPTEEQAPAAAGQAPTLQLPPRPANGARWATAEELAAVDARAAQEAKEARNAGVMNDILAVTEPAAGVMLPGLQAVAAKLGTGLQPEAIRELEETHPASNVLGQALGYALPAAATMGLGTPEVAGVGAASRLAEALPPNLISRAGAGVAKGLGGGLLAKAAGAAAEGALVSGEQMVNEASLGDPVLNAENIVGHPDVTGKYILDHLLEGTVIGGGLGLGAGLLGAGAEKVGRAVLPLKEGQSVTDYLIGAFRERQGELAIPATAGGRTNATGVVNKKMKQVDYDQMLEMARNIEHHLRSMGSRPDAQLRSRLKKLVKKEIKDVESLSHYMERMRELYGP